MFNQIFIEAQTKRFRSVCLLPDWTLGKLENPSQLKLKTISPSRPCLVLSRSQVHKAIENCRFITMCTQQNHPLIAELKKREEENLISTVKILHFQMTYDLMKIVFHPFCWIFQSSLICNRQTRTAHSFNFSFSPAKSGHQFRFHILLYNFADLSLPY